ncbi:MAG: CPBP family intramembrane metalloprotease [Acidimicrobiia bacterium]|nr:CPBP family intramembrane metalloprotease [Acidimicrobiia bacterium]
MPSPVPIEARARWGLLDVVAGFLIAQMAAILVTQVGWDALLPVGTALGAGLAGLAEGERLARSAGAPLMALVVAQLPLWGVLVGAVVFAGQVRGRGVVEDFGLRFRPIDVPVGLATGVGAQALVVLGYWLWGLASDGLDVDLPARQLAAKGDGAGILALVLLLGIVGPVAEEAFYRGLLLRSLERRLSPVVSLVLSAVIFAAVHIQAVQFAGLLLAGLAFGWLAQRTGRLGPAVCAHVAFNLTTLALLL